MKITIYITTEGCETKAKDPEARLCSWHFGCALSGDDLQYGGSVPEGAPIVFEQEFAIPADTDFLLAAKKSLEAELARKLAEAHKVEMDLKTRLSNLVAIGFERGAA